LRGADAALYAGLWQQLDLADKTFLYLSAGQTIRFGLAVGGQMQGANLLTDSIGRYLTALPDKNGAHPIEYAAAMPAMIRRFQKSKDDNALSWSDFCLAVAAGKRKACSILADAAFAMAVLIQNIALLTGGDRILLGGSALYDLPAYEAAIREQLSLLANQGFAVPTCLDNPHGRGILAVGAAAHVLEYNLGLSGDAS
jgi:predicted NBD/HSP70 family sugar kinase